MLHPTTKIRKSQNKLTKGVNLIEYIGEFITPTSDLIIMKLHVNNVISDIKY